MRRLLLAYLIIVCLLATLSLAGCLFGKKGGDEAAEGEGAPDVSSAGVKEAAPPPKGPGEVGGPQPSPPPTPTSPPGAGPASAEKLAGDPAKAKPLLAQARQAKAAADYDKALGLAQQAAAADPASADAHWIMAWIYAEKGQKDQAVAEFNAFVAGAGGDSRVGDAKAALKRLGPGAQGAPPAGMLKPPAPASGG